MKQLPCPALQLRKDAGATVTVSTPKESYFTVMRYDGGRRVFRVDPRGRCAGRMGAVFLQMAGGEVVFERFLVLFCSVRLEVSMDGWTVANRSLRASLTEKTTSDGAFLKTGTR